jgi:hypothetical protein
VDEVRYWYVPHVDDLCSTNHIHECENGYYGRSRKTQGKENRDKRGISTNVKERVQNYYCRNILVGEKDCSAFTR